jgi:hypothetical protein
MAHMERDNALVGGDAYAEEPKPQLTRRYTSGVPEYTKKPVFVKKERVPLSFANRKRRTVFSQDQEQVSNEQRNLSSESGESSSSNAEEREQQAPGSSVRPAPATGNWLSGRRMGLGDAYANTGDKEEFRSEFRARAAQGVRSASISSAEVIGATESRIPRSTAYSPGSSLVKSSPPKSLKKAYALAEREEQAAIDARLAIERAEMERADRDLAEREARAERERIEGEERLAQALGLVDYESESTGPRAASPSPAARPAMRPAYLEHGRPSSSRSSSDGSVGNKYPPPDPAKEAEWERTRLQAEKRGERMKRILANPRPIYLSDRRGGHASRIAEAKALLERKANSTDGEDVPEPRSSWGYKSRNTEAWMRRILNPDDPLLATFDPPLTSKSDVAQNVTADIPRSSIEVGPSAQPTPPSSRPNSAQPNNCSPEKSKMWDADIDFTAHSLLESTSPLLRVKTSRLDEVREREMQSLTARAVATNRLEEIRERNSEERSILSDSSRANTRETTPAPTKEPQEEVCHERTILEEEGEHIPNTPITIFAKGHYRPSTSSSSTESNQDPEKMREESFEAIRLLARRMSPGPQQAERLVEELKETRESRDNDEKETSAKVPEKAKRANKAKESEVEEQKREPRVAKAEEKPTKSSDRLEGKEKEKPFEERKNQFKRGGLDVDGEVKRCSTTSTPPKSDVDPEERITAEAKLFELPDNKSERNSTRAPSRSPSPSDDGKCDETPRPKADPLTLPTPKVTGAYIETPAPSTRKPRKSRSISPTYEMVNQVNDVPASSNNNSQQSSRRNSAAARAEERAQQKLRSTSSQPEITKQPSQPRTSKPALINTASRASPADDLRKIAMEEQYEDSTLDEFDAMLESDATAIQLMNSANLSGPIVDLEYDERGHHLSNEERERRIERLRLDRMNQQLKNTSFSIRDARHGIERLEHQVASATLTPTPVLDGQLYVHINLKIPVPRLVVSTPTQNRGRFAGLWGRNWKFTWLGLILFIFGLWYVMESAMCSFYCHPTQSSRNTWHPSDPFFPYAIPTKLNQWTGKIGSKYLANFGQWLDPGWGRNNGYMGASDWWLGRDGPARIVTNQEESIFDDEYI